MYFLHKILLLSKLKLKCPKTLRVEILLLELWILGINASGFFLIKILGTDQEWVNMDH